jgi:hypothetical protein
MLCVTLEYYTNPENHGYLADVKEEFIKSLGYNPDDIWRKGMAGPRPGSLAYKREKNNATAVSAGVSSSGDGAGSTSNVAV